MSQGPTPVLSCVSCRRHWEQGDEIVGDPLVSKVSDRCLHGCGRVVFEVTDEGPPYGKVVATTNGRVRPEF